MLTVSISAAQAVAKLGLGKGEWGWKGWVMHCFPCSMIIIPHYREKHCFPVEENTQSVSLDRELHAATKHAGKITHTQISNIGVRVTSCGATSGHVRVLHPWCVCVEFSNIIASILLTFVCQWAENTSSLWLVFPSVLVARRVTLKCHLQRKSMDSKSSTLYKVQSTNVHIKMPIKYDP